MSDSDKQALLDGTAAIQTKIEIVKENLFDKNNVNSLNGCYIGSSGANVGKIISYSPAKTIYIPIEANTTYTISKVLSTQFVVSVYDDIPTTGSIGTNTIANFSGTTITITSTNNSQYLAVFLYVSSDTLTFEEILNTVRIEEGTPIILTEENSVISWDYEDFRYVKNEGWIGQFVARQVTGKLKNISDDFTITDKEFELKLGVKVEDNTNWYSLGDFLVSKVTDDEVGDVTSFEALDYTKKFNKVYEDTITYPCTALELAQNVCEQCDVELATTEFTNSNYIIEGNPFINNETCRDVMKAIGKLAFSWVRVDWDNRVYIDFTYSNSVSEYDTINNSKYYSLKTQKANFGPVNKVIIGYSQIEGERTYIDDPESIEQNGLCELTIYDNPLVYTQEQRELLIDSASRLFGITYLPLEVLTVGHPWLKGKELISVTDMENVEHTTIPFDRTIQYFGHIKTLINSNAPTRTNTENAYPANIATSLKKVEIDVDKINGTITEEILGENPNSLQSQVSKSVRDIEALTNIFQITGGSNIIKNSQFLLPDKTWVFENYPDTSNNYHTALGEGYDNDLIGSTIASAKITLRNMILSSSTEDTYNNGVIDQIKNIDGLIQGQTYTLSYLYNQDALTTTRIRLIDGNGNIVQYFTTEDEQTKYYDLDITYNEEQKTRKSETFQFIATTKDYQLIIETYTTSNENGYFYIYDLMLNSGDKKQWEPASSEIYSTVLQMSQQGLKVISTGSSIATLLNARGLNIYKYDVQTGQISGEPVTEFDDNGLTTYIAIMSVANIDGYVMKTITINNKRHHIEYFGGE